MKVQISSEIPTDVSGNSIVDWSQKQERVKHHRTCRGRELPDDFTSSSLPSSTPVKLKIIQHSHERQKYSVYNVCCMLS